MRLYDNIVGEIIECADKKVIEQEAKHRIRYYETKGLNSRGRYNKGVNPIKVNVIRNENEIIIERGN